VEAFAREQGAAVAEEGPGHWRIERKPAKAVRLDPYNDGAEALKAAGLEEWAVSQNGCCVATRDLRGG